MRKMIDAVSGGRLWIEIAAGLTIWHVEELDEHGDIVRSTAVSDSKKAKAEWNKLKSKRPAWVAEKGGGGLTENGLQKILKPVGEILKRGNTAEVVVAKDGILVLEVKKKVAVRGVEADQ